MNRFGLTILISTTIFLLISFPFVGKSQTTRAVNGVVYSNVTGKPVQGASIRSKASGQTVVSGELGEFVFSNILATDTVVISTIGYLSKEVPVSNVVGHELVVYLKEAFNYIDEVIVNTGYQSLPKERATGSFSQIDNQLINRNVSANVINRLEGITNGLSFELPRTTGAPSTTPDLRIRGLSTINGETEPLIVLDNFPYEGDISNINPNDVESITILKDAAAASIWGARAGNGVIVINSKRGGMGRSPVVTINSNLSISERPDLYYSPMFLPPADAVELERALYRRGLYPNNDWTAYSPAVDILFALEEGRIDEATATGLLNGLKMYDIREQAEKFLYRQKVDQQYAVNVSGGGKKYAYYISAGFDNSAEELVGNGSNRVTFNVKNDFEPVAGLHVSTGISYTQRNSTTNGIDLLGLSPTGSGSIYPYARLADEDGNALPIVRNNRFSYTDSALEMGLLDWHYRPLDELSVNDNTATSQEVRLNTSVRYQLLKNLSVGVRHQYQNIGSAARNHHSEESYIARHEINRFTQADGSRPVPLGGILDRSDRKFTSHYSRIQLNYNGELAEKHQLDGLAGFELRQDFSRDNGSTRLYGYNEDILTSVSDLNYGDNFPIRPRFTGRISSRTNAGSQVIDRFVSYYANLAYAYADRYILSSSVRWDASNIFGVAFNQKGVPLWSLGIAWNVTNEQLLNIDWIDNLKLRMTYGANGNAVRSLSSLPYIRYGGTNLASRLPSAQLISVGNPDLRWEQVNTLNAGLDFAVVAKRITGSLEWYVKRSGNLIGYDFIDPTTGVFGYGSGFNLDNRRNYADMDTRGVDLELHSLNTDGKLKWQSSLMFSQVSNRITNYKDQQNALISEFFNQYGAPVIEGASKDQMYAIPWQGLDNTGAPLVLLDGKLTTDYNAYFNGLKHEDLIKIGYSMPTVFGSILNTFSWRSLSVGINIRWKGGYKFRRESVVYSELLRSGNSAHLDYLNRWQKQGDEFVTNIPAMPEGVDLRRDQAYLFSDALVERGDHIRLQDINLTYQLPYMMSSKIGLSDVSIYAFANNLVILWKRTKFDVDPDVRALYPRTRQFSIGLKIKI